MYIQSGLCTIEIISTTSMSVFFNKVACVYLQTHLCRDYQSHPHLLDHQIHHPHVGVHHRTLLGDLYLVDLYIKKYSEYFFNEIVSVDVLYTQMLNVTKSRKEFSISFQIQEINKKWTRLKSIESRIDQNLSTFKMIKLPNSLNAAKNSLNWLSYVILSCLNRNFTEKKMWTAQWSIWFKSISIWMKMKASG